MYLLPIYNDITKTEEKTKNEQPRVDIEKSARKDDNPRPYKFDDPTKNLATDNSDLPNMTIQPLIKIENMEKTSTRESLFIRYKEPQNDQTLAYRLLKRKPILKELLTFSEHFIESIETAEAAMYYSFMKERVNNLWEYVGKDESFALALVTVESALNLNSWKDYKIPQANALDKAIEKLNSQEINNSEVVLLADNFRNAGLNIFPSIDDVQEEKEVATATESHKKK